MTNRFFLLIHLKSYKLLFFFNSNLEYFNLLFLIFIDVCWWYVKNIHDIHKLIFSEYFASTKLDYHKSSFRVQTEISGVSWDGSCRVHLLVRTWLKRHRRSTSGFMVYRSDVFMYKKAEWTLNMYGDISIGPRGNGLSADHGLTGRTS